MISFSQRIENAQDTFYTRESDSFHRIGLVEKWDRPSSPKSKICESERKVAKKGVRKKNKGEVKIMFAVVIFFPTYGMRKKKVRKEGEKWK